MRLLFIYLGALAAVAGLAVGVGLSPTRLRWGIPGVASMWAALGICMSAAVVAAGLVVFVAARHPTYLAQAALGGSVIRLGLTGALTLAYQTTREVHLSSFLTWLLILYLGLLAVEVGLNVALAGRRRTGDAAGAGR